MRAYRLLLIATALVGPGMAVAAQPIRPSQSLPAAQMVQPAPIQNIRDGVPVGQSDELLGSYTPLAIMAFLLMLSAAIIAAKGDNGSTSP